MNSGAQFTSGASGGAPTQSDPNLGGSPPQPVPLRLHHVGCAVRSIERALAYYTGVLGFKQVTPPIEVPSQRVKVCFVEASSEDGDRHPAPGLYLELVEGVGADSPVQRLLENTDGGPYHLCFEVQDLDAAIRWLRSQGFFRLTRFELAAHGLRRFAFMLTPDRQLIELCERDVAETTNKRGL
jgi:methylmalonyl-CoA/ethylmalonyl-CoA epimerase